MDLIFWLLYEIVAFILLFTSFLMYAFKHRTFLKAVWLMPLVALVLFGYLGFAPIDTHYKVTYNLLDQAVCVGCEMVNHTVNNLYYSSHMDKLLLNFIFSLISFIMFLILIITGLSQEYDAEAKTYG